MASNRPPANKALDAKVLARRQKDLDGYVLKHQTIVDARTLKYAAEMDALWKRIGRNITDEIKSIYNLVQDAQGVPITKQPIDPAKLNNMRRQLDRLRTLQRQLVDMLGTDAQKAKMDRNLAFTYSEAYYFHAFGLEQSAKVMINAPILTQGHVIGALVNPWLPDGRTYSDRLRANTQYLADKMLKTVENALGSGWSINRTAREIQKNAQEGYYNAVRLARTEINRAAAQGANHLYMQNSDIMDGKRWNAVLDSRTAPKDAQNDGGIFDLDYDTPENPGEAGKRIPNHPNCRCKWSPVLSALGVSARERIARGDDDTKKQFGERSYTDARTYREYAAKRGFPDLDDAVRNENPVRYLRRGETVADIPKNFFDPFVVVRVNKTTFTAGEAAKVAVIDTAFQAASSIKEANKWASANIPEVKMIDYGGFDLRLANEVNEELYKLYKLYPEIEDVNFIGTAQKRNKLLYDRQVAQFLQANKQNFQGLDQKTIDLFVKKYIKKKTVPGNTYAQAANNTWGDQAGIAFNEKYAKNYDMFKQSIESDVRSGYHPVGTDKPVSVLVHEFGHSIDYFLVKVGLRDKYLTPVTREALKDPDLGNVLSRYAKVNDREVIAEAFSEYRLNPNPRKWARKVGEAIEQALEEYRKGRS